MSVNWRSYRAAWTSCRPAASSRLLGRFFVVLLILELTGVIDIFKKV